MVSFIFQITKIVIFSLKNTNFGKFFCFFSFRRVKRRDWRGGQKLPTKNLQSDFFCLYFCIATKKHSTHATLLRGLKNDFQNAYFLSYNLLKNIKCYEEDFCTCTFGGLGISGL